MRLEAGELLEDEKPGRREARPERSGPGLDGRGARGLALPGRGWVGGVLFD